MPLTLYELNMLKRNIIIAKKLKTKIDSKKKSAENASPNLSGMPSSHGGFEHTSDLILSYIDDEKNLDMLCKKITSENAKALKFIKNISDPQLHLIFRYRFIKGYSWVKVAMEIGGGNTGDSVRKQVTRYLSSEK